MRTKRMGAAALTVVALTLAAACGDDDDDDGGAADTEAPVGTEAPAGTGGGGSGDYVIGVSNTLAGNGWREEMICAVKAEALASGQSSRVIAISKNGGPRH